MSGIDASGGFAYQHARAVLEIIEMLDKAEIEKIRVEAENDVVDIEQLDDLDNLKLAIQVKRRAPEYSWSAKNIMDELSRWSDLAKDHPDSKYVFITDGRLGPSALQLEDALAQSKCGEPRELKKIAAEHAAEICEAACNRASIITCDDDFNTILESAERLTIARIPTTSGKSEAEGRAKWVVLSILKMVVNRSGIKDPNQRIIRKSEISNLLSEDPTYYPKQTWTTSTKEKYISACTKTNAPTVNIPYTQTTGSSNTSITTILDVLPNSDVILVTGESGSGKSTKVLQEQKSLAHKSKIPVLVNAEMYVEGRLAALIAKGINNVEYLAAFTGTGHEALQDPQVVICFDNISEISNSSQIQLKREINEALSSDRHASFVLIGRDEVALRKMLITDINYCHLRMTPLTRASRQKIIASYFSDEQERSILLAQSESALGDAVSNPQFFIVSIILLKKGANFTDPASMYSAYFTHISEFYGYSNSSIYLSALGLIFSEVSQNGTRFVNSFEWGLLTRDAKNKLADLGFGDHDLHIMQFALQTGFVVKRSGDIVSAVHDSWADYYSAIAYKSKLREFPSNLKAGDHKWIEFFTEMNGIDVSVLELISRDLPFLLPKIQHRDERNISEETHAEVYQVLSNLMPPGVDVPKFCIGYNQSLYFCSVDGNREGWIGSSHSGIEVSAALIFEIAGGPATVAVSIWSYFVRNILEKKNNIGSFNINSWDNAFEFLEKYSELVHEELEILADAICPSGQEEILREILLSETIQFDIPRSHDGPVRNMPVKSRSVQDSSLPIVCIDASTDDIFLWTSSSTLDYFIRLSPYEYAVERVKAALDKLTTVRNVLD